MNHNSDTKELLSASRASLIFKRFALELVENYVDLKELAIIGLQPRGVALAEVVMKELKATTSHDVLFGTLDNTFYRDDIGRSGEIHIPKPSKIDFSTEGKRIVLIDDVLYTGRSVRSAIDGLMRFGRPQSIELMVLVDRVFQREVPIKPDYIGVSIDSRNTEHYVRVNWLDDNEAEVWLKDKEND